MPIVSLNELKKELGAEYRLLGLDVGGKTIGLALSDVGHMIASPLITIRRTKFTMDAARLSEIIDQHDVGGFIIGLPLSMDGSEGPRCQSIRQFAANLLGIIDLPTAFHDERLSTSAVERTMITDADMSRKRRREIVDRTAASYILQGALDIMANLSASRPPTELTP